MQEKTIGIVGLALVLLQLGLQLGGVGVNTLLSISFYVLGGLLMLYAVYSTIRKQPLLKIAGTVK
jgi:predicted membrane channel-forming protein YqfA (hemolysin III family)